MQRNREAAKESRRRKQGYVEHLETVIMCVHGCQGR
jgi:hypothetical protein